MRGVPTRGGSKAIQEQYLVVQLHNGPLRHLIPLEPRHRGPHPKGHPRGVRDDGQVAAVGVVHPVARVVVRGDGDAGRHGGQEAAHDFVEGHAEGLEDGGQQRAPLGVVDPGELEAALEEVVGVDEDDLCFGFGWRGGLGGR